MKRLRRCEEDRWDFTEKDGSAFPIQISTGGPTFGFCPAKVLRDDPDTIEIFHMVNLILDTGTWPDSGGINDQQEIWVELVREFAQVKKDLEWNNRIAPIAKGLGGGDIKS